MTDVKPLSAEERARFRKAAEDGSVTLMSSPTALRRLILGYEATLRASEQARDEARGCPHGDNCACAIGSRHEWLEAYSEARSDVLKLGAERDALQARVDAAEAQLTALADGLAQSGTRLEFKAESGT